MTCLEWRLKYVNISIILALKLMSHACALQIDNVGNYLCLNKGSFKFEVNPHQFNLRLHYFSQFQREKKRKKREIFKSWQVCDWPAKWLIVFGFMDLRWPRVYRRSNVGLVYVCCSYLFPFKHYFSVCVMYYHTWLFIVLYLLHYFYLSLLLCIYYTTFTCVLYIAMYLSIYILKVGD